MSEGSIAIVKKFDLAFLWFSFLYHPTFKKCVLEKMFVCLSPIIEPKPIDLSRSNSISRDLL